MYTLFKNLSWLDYAFISKFAYHFTSHNVLGNCQILEILYPVVRISILATVKETAFEHITNVLITPINNID